MSIVDDVKELAKLIQQIDNIELYKLIIDLQGEILKTLEENNSLREQVKNLQESMKIKNSLIFQSNSYWIPNDTGGKEGPFCTHCWDIEERLVRMLSDGLNLWFCQTHGKPSTIVTSGRNPFYE